MHRQLLSLHPRRGGAAFEKAYRILRARIEAFVALPLQTLVHDKAALEAELDRIAAITDRGKAGMKTIQVFDPAPCSHTGACAPEFASAFR